MEPTWPWALCGRTVGRAWMQMFKECIRDTIEVFIDDIVVKSLRSQDYLGHLKKDFQILREHKMMLNPAKRIF